MDITKLTQEQQWGLAYKCQTANEQAKRQSTFIVGQNARIEKENENLIEKRPLLPVPKELTVEEYLLAQLAQMGNEGYSALIAVKEQSALKMFRSMSPEQQAELVKQFAIPDVLK